MLEQEKHSIVHRRGTQEFSRFQNWVHSLYYFFIGFRIYCQWSVFCEQHRLSAGRISPKRRFSVTSETDVTQLWPRSKAMPNRRLWLVWGCGRNRVWTKTLTSLCRSLSEVKRLPSRCCPPWRSWLAPSHLPSKRTRTSPRVYSPWIRACRGDSPKECSTTVSKAV